MNNFNKNIPAELMNRMLTDNKLRRAITRESHNWFFHLYFSEYVTYPTANFQRKIFELTENNDPLTVIEAFRGSGKSTIVSMSYPIWAILGKQQKKFVVIFSRTQKQAKLIFSNLKTELENNELLRKDLGPFKDESAEWNNNTLVIPRHNARIMIASSEQSIRGIRHGAHRPDLLICDDIEDLDSVKTQDGRDKTFDWLASEVINLGDKCTKTIIVGNLLHRDSALTRLKDKIESKEMDGSFHEFPLMRGEEILWSEKFKSIEDIEKLRRKVPDEATFQREYMLFIVTTCEQVINEEWLEYYSEIPPNANLVEITISVDLAISEKSKSDYTAIVMGTTYEINNEYFMFIRPYIINKRMDFPTTINVINDLYNSYSEKGNVQVLIEDVGMQRAVAQQLREINELINVKTIVPKGDKRMRLALTSELIKRGKVKFPHHGIEPLLNQVIGFGSEKHDDLADSFSQLVNYFSKSPQTRNVGSIRIR